MQYKNYKLYNKFKVIDAIDTILNNYEIIEDANENAKNNLTDYEREVEWYLKEVKDKLLED